MEPTSEAACPPSSKNQTFRFADTSQVRLGLMPAAILHLLRSAQVEETGPARIVAALGLGINRSKYHVHAWCLGPDGPLVDYLRNAGVTTRSVGWFPGSRNPVGAYQFLRGMRSDNFAIVHHHFGDRVIRKLIRMTSDAKIVVHLHALFRADNFARNVASAVQSADVVISASRALALQIPHVKSAVIYAGVETRDGCPSASANPRDEIVIGAACRLVDMKGLEYLLRAMALFTADFPSVRLEVAGTGPDREKLAAGAARLGLASRVRFLGWQADIRATLRGWDIFAMPSLTEAFPIAALEAMAEGLPIVATDAGGLPELVEDGVTGYLVPIADVGSFSRCLRRLIANPAERRAMGAAGRQRTDERFSIKKMVSGIEAIYDSLTLSSAAATSRDEQAPPIR